MQLCEASLQAQFDYVSSNPLRFGAFVESSIACVSSALTIFAGGCFALVPLPHVEETINFIRKASELRLRPDGWAVTTQIGSNKDIALMLYSRAYTLQAIDI